MQRVLILEDCEELARLYSLLFSSFGWECETAFSSTEALQILSRNPNFSAAIVDLMMAPESGLPAIYECQRLSVPVIVVTGLSVASAQKTCPPGITILTKPANLFELEEQVRKHSLRSKAPSSSEVHTNTIV